MRAIRKCISGWYSEGFEEIAEEAQAELFMLYEALKPFADKAVFEGFDDDMGVRSEFTARQFRRAAAALAALKGDGE